MTALAFPCAAKVYSDGSWYCAVCGIRGDSDEAPEDYCPKQRTRPQNDTPPAGTNNE